MVKILKRLAGFEKPEVEYDEDELQELAENDDSLEVQNEEQNEEQWLEDDYAEGQLSIDVYQTDRALVVKSTIAGVKTEDIDISINNDMLTIRGKREMSEEIKEENYLYKECYWGSFSRSVILPVEIEEDKIDALLENGVLTIILPKSKSNKHISIKVKER